jgi:preprotein translocase subunit SecB
MTMADQNTTPAGAGDPPTNGQGPAVALQTVYIKDLSFEAPKGPFLPAQVQDPRFR